jgi:hypothetical protein
MSISVRVARYASLVALTALGCGAPDAHSPPPDAPITGGALSGWPEASAHLHVTGTGAATSLAWSDARAASGLDAFWSVASTAPGRGFFYGDSFFTNPGTTRVASVEPGRHIADVRDAESLTYDAAVGPVDVGRVVVLHDTASGQYLALEILRIYPAKSPDTSSGGPFAFADVVWALSGTPDFSRFAPPR